MRRTHATKTQTTPIGHLINHPRWPVVWWHILVLHCRSTDDQLHVGDHKDLLVVTEQPNETSSLLLVTCDQTPPRSMSAGEYEVRLSSGAVLYQELEIVTPRSKAAESCVQLSRKAQPAKLSRAAFAMQCARMTFLGMPGTDFYWDHGSSEHTAISRMAVVGSHVAVPCVKGSDVA